MAAEIHEEIVVSLKNEVGALANVLKTIADARVNMTAFCAYAMGNEGYAHIVADQPAKAKEALEKAGLKFELHPVVVAKVSDKPGAGAELAGRIAEKGVNIEHCYATGVGRGQANVVIRTADNGKAKEAIG